MDMSHQPQEQRPLLDWSSLPILQMAIFGAVILVGGFVIALLEPRILPPVGSVQAQNTDALFRVLLVLGGAVFLLVQGLLVYSVVRFRAKAGDTSDGPTIHGNVTLEIVWTIIPAIVVTILAILSFIVWSSNTTIAANENFVNGQAMQINAIGQRFAWNFEYLTNDTNINGEPIRISTNELHTYIGQNLKLEMRTQDVIHSFWVPAMRVKQDLLPGRDTTIRFTPIRVEGETYPARYRLICTELCGSGHGNMYSWLVVHESEEAYLANWYSPIVQALYEPPSDPVARAELVIGGYPCANCHALDSLGWAGITGPSLNGIADRAGRRVGGLSAVEYLVQSLHHPNDYLVPGYAANLMPAFGLSAEAPAGTAGSYTQMPEDDLIAIVAFLCTQTVSGELSDSACGLNFEDAQAVTDAIQAVNATYYAEYGIE